MPEQSVSLYHKREFYIGLSLAVSSSFFIGTSFIIKKKALLRLNRIGSVRAGAGGYGYLKEWIWWAGLLCMGLGEALNFGAFAFAPASLITTLGALSVLVAAVMSSKFLNEKLNLLGKLGCLLCGLGSTLIVLHSPKENDIQSLNQLYNKMQDSSFVIFVMVMLTTAVIFAVHIGPRYGNTNVMVYVIVCSTMGSLTVMMAKGLGVALRDQISGKSDDFSTFFPYFLLFLTIAFITIQMNYLNKALDIFNTSIITPVYYVLFTTLVIIASAILFKEWENMDPTDVIGNLCAFIVIIVAVILLNAFKDFNITLDDLRYMSRPKRNSNLGENNMTLDGKHLAKGGNENRGYGSAVELYRDV